MKNYRTIKLPDCCAVCQYHGLGYICEDICYKSDCQEVDINGICDDFERILNDSNK